MDRAEYTMMVQLKNKMPPNKETPVGQKFHIGEIVKIIDCRDRDDECEGKLAEIEYSYKQKYNGTMPHHIRSYSLIHLWEDNGSAWWDEEQLELVKGIKKVNEEKDFAEYKRLKAKYDGA